MSRYRVTKSAIYSKKVRIFRSPHLPLNLLDALGTNTQAKFFHEATAARKAGKIISAFDPALPKIELHICPARFNFLTDVRR